MQILILQIFNKFVKPNKNKIARGFTFIEILVVLSLVVMIIGFVTPNFLKIFNTPFELEFKHLNKVIKILRNDAILKNHSYCMILDLNKQQMVTTKLNLGGECENDFLKKPKILAPRFFSEEIILKEARIAEKDFFEYDKSLNLLKIHINNSGFVTPFFLKFSSRDFSKSWEIKTVGIMGRLKLN